MTKTQADRLLLALDRRTETNAAVAAAPTALESYWAGSATASLIRDYRAGRVVVVKAGRQ